MILAHTGVCGKSIGMVCGFTMQYIPNLTLNIEFAHSQGCV